MPVFTFYINKDRDAVPSFEIALFDDIDPALAYGRRLLKERPRCHSVDISRDDTDIAKLTRDAV